MKKQVALISLGFFLSTIQAMETDEDGFELFTAIGTITPNQVEASLKRGTSPDITNARGETPYQVAVKLFRSLCEEYKPLNDRVQLGSLDKPFVNELMKCLDRMYACAQIIQMVKTK